MGALPPFSTLWHSLHSVSGIVLTHGLCLLTLSCVSLCICFYMHYIRHHKEEQLTSCQLLSSRVILWGRAWGPGHYVIQPSYQESLFRCPSLVYWAVFQMGGLRGTMLGSPSVGNPLGKWDLAMTHTHIVIHHRKKKLYVAEHSMGLIF